MEIVKANHTLKHSVKRNNPFQIPLNQDLVKVLVSFIKQETSRFGINHLVIGLSGGIDSTVAAYLAQKALGSKNVLGILMPYKASSPDSIKDALAVVKALKIKSRLIPVTKAVDGLEETIGLNTRLKSDVVRKGNIIARMRMICLYDQSNEFKALVLGTGNKTEILLGYTTLYGDSASAINPIGDLYKTQIWQLAELLKCPKQIIKKKPSADLWKGQMTKASLVLRTGADELLYYMVDQRFSTKSLPNGL
jgi:NAD+ synthase